MRILILHSRYLSGAVSGENRVVEDEARLLSDAGHEVEVWTPAPADSGGLDLVRVGVDAIWSRAAVANVVERIERFSPDIVHCHNLFPALSPAVLRACARTPVASVVTLHSYRLMCAPGTFVRDGRICEDCLGKGQWRSVIHRCHRDSALASAALSASMSLHRAMGSFAGATLYLAVSEFMAQKYEAAGLFPKDKIMVKSNFAWPTPVREGGGEYFLYLGRLAPEKGTATLLRAWERVPAELKIVGDGPEADQLRRDAPRNVSFTGAIPSDEVPGVLAKARALLVPSEWYEGQPRGILEAYAAGVPVIASRIGGLPEVVHEGKTGLLCEPGDPGAWAEAAVALSHDGEAERLGHGAHDEWTRRFSPSHGLASLEAAYEQALRKSASQPSVSR
jgi:glycosyltransferase involved in cell wall biosynthesis